MVSIRNPVGKGACWISRLKCQLVMEGMASELLVTNLSSLFLSLLISSCIGENVGTLFFFDDADVLIASKWARKSSSAFWPSRSNTLGLSFGAPPVSFSLVILVVLWTWGEARHRSIVGLDGLALVFVFLLFGTAEWVDSARDWGT